MESNSIGILFISADTSLAEEIESVLKTISTYRVEFWQAHQISSAIDMLKSRRPQLILVDAQVSLSALKELVDEKNFIKLQSIISYLFYPGIQSGESSEGEFVIEALRMGINDFFHRPISKIELINLLKRTQELGQEESQASGNGAITSFISNKGGVGKTTLAVNTACGLAALYPDRVLLVDTSLQLGLCSSMLNVTPAATLSDIAKQRDRLDETLLKEMATIHESGLHLLAAPNTAVEASYVTDEIISRVLHLARRQYDYIIVDTFPLFESTLLVVLDLSTSIYVVLENVVPTLQGGMKLLELLRSMGYSSDQVRLILNRVTKYSGQLSINEISESLGQKINHVLPFDSKLMVSANTGNPYAMSYRRFTKFQRHFDLLLNEIASTSEKSLETK
ncbi:MAG: AAA family ATPase [Pirellulaceae bacterium]|nr:AAA family ATPase [Pirellulaceae bacterium]